MKTLPIKVQQGIDEALKKYPSDRQQSAIKDALRLAQDAHDGWLTTEIMDAVAQYLNISRFTVYEVATFYTLFDTKPVGRMKVNVCTNISCALSGADEVVKYLEKQLGISLGETTPDGSVTLREVECLAACVGAPALQCNGVYHEKLTPEKLLALIQVWRAQ